MQQEMAEENEQLEDVISTLVLVQAQPPSDIGATRYSLFDDEKGDDWLQDEPDDWWQQEPDDPDTHFDAFYGTVNQEGESVQAALHARLRLLTKLTFFDDESGDDEMQLEPDDFNLIKGLVDRRGLPEFSKAAKKPGSGELSSPEPGLEWCSNVARSVWDTTGTNPWYAPYL